MAQLVRALDWAGTPLGPLSAWPQSLRSALSICLGSRFPIVIYWGPDLVVLYNDVYAEILGKKHPWALGRPCREVWSEIWDVIGPMFDRVLTRGEATWSEDQLLLLERRGYPEECYFSFSFSPVRSADGGIEGIFTAVIENTARVLSERRLRTLRDLGISLAEVRSAQDACRAAAEILAGNRADVPFALLYLVDPQSRQGALVASTVDDGSVAPACIDLDHPDESAVWPLAEVCRSGQAASVDAPASPALILPLAAAGEPHCSGVMVVGISRHRELDQEYRGFFELIARRVAAAIAEARTYEAERRRAEALAELDRAKTAFFSNVSHEFRTPLTLMLGPLEDLMGELRRSGAPPALRLQVDLARRNGIRLLKLVNTLLDFARIEAGRVQAVFEPSDLAAMTAELASVFRSAVEKAGLRLIVDCPALAEPAYVDREMWEKIILNLVSNAFKFTFEGEIEVRLRAADGHFELAVRDTGIGIPADELPRLFERFHRVAGTHGRTHEGSGIGLALVQELVRLHGGSVSVESRAREGSTFRVLIPRGCDHLAAEQIGAARRLASTALGATAFVDEALRWLPGGGAESDSVLEDVAPAQGGELSADRPVVLLADDNADMREYLRRLLASHYHVEAVADGEAALSAIARRKPDLLLTDIMMPRLGGIELLGRLRADATTNTLPVILLSARAGEESRIEGLQSGADDYLIKPFSARELLARVEAHVKMARFRDEAAAALRESEARFRHMADHAPVMIWVTEADASCTFLSQSWYRFTGHMPEFGRGFGWLEAVHPDDRQPARDAFVAANARREPFRIEYRLRRRDGEYCWAIDAGAPRFDATGAFLGYVGSVIDITERKRAEETQRLLIDELQHRVKNTLANVQAIAQHTLRQTRDPARFAESFSGRIRSLARVHTMLSASTWHGADLQDLVRDQLADGATDETRITAWGPPVTLEPQTSLHVALMLHELGTNAIKHGALSVPGGRVTISWRVEDLDLRLRWEESGGPAPRAATARGFGTTLIEQSAKGEGGKAHMLTTADGVAWDITLRLPRSPAQDATMQAAPESQAVSGHRPGSGESRPPGILAGRRFLVVEDEPLVALDLSAGLQDAGAEVVAWTGSVDEALGVIESRSLDAALVDGNLHDRPVDEIAAALSRRSVPFAFVSGYRRESLPQAFGTVPLIAKPFSQAQLLDVARQLVGRAGTPR